MPMIGAAYLRCSDPRQDKSIDQQREEITRRAAADGVVIPPQNWFIDEGISGRSTKKRSSYLALIRLAEAQRDAPKGRNAPASRVDRVYVWAFSRIARNMFDCLRALATLDDADIEVVSLTETDGGDRSMRKLIRPILAWLAERYSEELSRNVQRGLRSQAERGFWVYGNPPYGYDAVPVQGGRRLEVTEATRGEFEVVQRIFREAADGPNGAKRMSQALTRDGIAPPHALGQPRTVAAGTWRPKHIDDILNNPLYLGHVLYQGEIVCRGAHEAAVDDATFERVKASARCVRAVVTKGSATVRTRSPRPNVGCSRRS